jgi:hypothetical protein
MKKIVGYLRSYLTEVDKRILLLSTLFIGFFIFLNYQFRIEKAIIRFPLFEKYISWFLIFILAFSFPYLLRFILKRKLIHDPKFYIFLFLAAALFAWKLSFIVHFSFSANTAANNYWNYVAYWPFKLITVAGCLWLIWKAGDSNQPFYGLSKKNLEIRPYLIMLLLMVPLVALASTQKDFLAMYPKLKHIQFFLHQKNSGLYKLFYELSYGSDFFTIELFFRGFLVLAFIKWAGKDAILPMALFYCTIHFGKPIGECISSYFGGIILGVITYHTRSILGGLMVHLGIAWLMELGGYLGNAVSQ